MHDDKAIEAYVDAAAALIGVPIAPEHRPGVLRNLQLVAMLAPRVLDFPVGAADESGNVFRPVEPDATDAGTAS